MDHAGAPRRVIRPSPCEQSGNDPPRSGGTRVACLTVSAEGREYDSGAAIMAGDVVECAAAGYQPERRVISRAVNDSGREFGLGVLAHTSHPENGGDSVGECHVYGVSGM